MVSVADTSHLGWSVEGDGGKWRRRLLAWEEEVVVCSFLLTSIVLQDDVEDKCNGTYIHLINIQSTMLIISYLYRTILLLFLSF